MTNTFTYLDCIADGGTERPEVTGVVWSPGPLANTVWALPYSGASASEAVVVHAPDRHFEDWYRIELTCIDPEHTTHEHCPLHGCVEYVCCILTP